MTKIDRSLRESTILEAPPERASDSFPDDLADVVVIGGGIAGMATAARLQALGLKTRVLEAHATPGGCAGWYRRRGFSFDVGATTLVDFEAGGVGAEFAEAIGLDRFVSEALPGYVAWLPDRQLRLHRNAEAWAAERLAVLGDSPRQRRFWRTVDGISRTYWRVSRSGAALPLRSTADFMRAITALGLGGLPSARYLNWTLGDLLRRCGLEHERPLRGLLAMLVEDTVHGEVDSAPLVNAALGVTIRGAGLSRASGGMAGFWRQLIDRYRDLGGELVTRCRVEQVTTSAEGHAIQTNKGRTRARQVVSALPAELTAQLAPEIVEAALRPHLARNENARGAAVVVCLGVPEAEVEGQPWTHHQLLQDYDAPLGMGNNMFISVSSPGDLRSAPEGHRAVMISTHCELARWSGLEAEDYRAQKEAIERRLIQLARRVYPRLGMNPLVVETATPRSYERFTSRPGGAVGGYRLSLRNANSRAIPQDVGVPGFHLVGDTTWPGLGTVACVLGSRIAARNVLAQARRSAR